MSISPGTRFGSYQVAEPIGSGGMGEVYRARDTTLGRDVAIKVLPTSFSNDAMRVARFEQEAKTLASLNQANIAHIYGLERSDGNTGIVMELVDGQTLVDRITEGPIPVGEALRIAAQIADALEAAHERAIVHRDLKPANVKIRPDGTVKVLDFGIAKALDPRFLTGPGPAALTTPAMTEAGFILGTAAYMSPEQARGKFVDQRTDVWAFGCVLYEMLTGKPAFLGEDVTSTLARVLEVGANLSALPTGVPPAVRRTLELCLEKDARKRIADMRDVKLALAGTFATGAPAQPQRQRALPIAAAVVGAALLAGAAAWLLKPAPAPDPKIVTRFNYTLPAGVSFSSSHYVRARYRARRRALRVQRQRRDPRPADGGDRRAHRSRHGRGQRRCRDFARRPRGRLFPTNAARARQGRNRGRRSGRDGRAHHTSLRPELGARRHALLRSDQRDLARLA